MSTEDLLKQTPLYQQHLSLKAKMVPFGGWAMPVQYESIVAEYDCTRHACSLFDTSHMGEFFVDGDAVKSGLDFLVTQPIKDMPLKTCRYGVMLNEQGGIIDDLIVFRIEQEHWLIVVNAGTMEKDERQFQKFIRPSGNFANRSAQLGKLDIQGPRSRELLNGLIPDIGKLAYYAFDHFDLLGENVLVSRTGYTGELGYEIYFPWDRTPELWDELLKRGARPAGLGARDLLRIEMGYSLYGHELEENICPLDAGLERFVDWDKDFFGKAALLKKKDSLDQQKIICFISESRRSPRQHHRIYDQKEELIGEVTSGIFSPHFKQGVGLGFVKKELAKKGDTIYFGDDKNKLPAEVVSRPIYKQGSLKS